MRKILISIAVIVVLAIIVVLVMTREATAPDETVLSSSPTVQQ